MSDILIKDMEMPKEGSRAFMIVFSDGKAAISVEPFEWHEVILIPDHENSNADRIRAMSVEELAAWIADHPVVASYDKDNQQHKKWLDWLKQEATE